MRKSKFTEEQMAYALKQAELGISVEDVCRKMGISSATCLSGLPRHCLTDCDQPSSESSLNGETDGE